MKLYLDSSAWVKRYLTEEGSREIDLAFQKASFGPDVLVSSFWNIGECLGVFDKRRQRKELGGEEFRRILQNFFSETIDLAGRGNLTLTPVSAELLLGCWRIIMENHMYQADALQLKTSAVEGCSFLITADEGLVEVAEKLGLKAIPIEKKGGQKKLRELLKA